MASNHFTPVVVTIFSPNGNIVTIDQFDPRNGKFSFKLDTSGPLWKQTGTYTVTAQQGGSLKASDDFYFTGPPEPQYTPPTTATPPTPPTITGNVIENVRGSSTPGCEPNCFIPATITINAGESVIFQNSDNAAHTSTSYTDPEGTGFGLGYSEEYCYTVSTTNASDFAGPHSDEACATTLPYILVGLDVAVDPVNKLIFAQMVNFWPISGYQFDVSIDDNFTI